MGTISIRKDKKKSNTKISAYLIFLDGEHIGWIDIRTVKLNWPVHLLLRFLYSKVITKMFSGVSRDFQINYFWLNILCLERPYHGKGYAVQALNLALERLPAYSVLAGYAYEVTQTKLEDIVRFYKKHNFHILRNTRGNSGDPIIFTFVQNK